MKTIFQKIIAVILTFIITVSVLPITVSTSALDFPVFSINITNETDTQATVSINLDKGQFEYVTFYVIPENNITSCESINKSSFLADIITNLENNGNTVLIADNNVDFMVTVASTGKFTQAGSYFEFVMNKKTSDKLTKSDVTISISDIGATFVNNLPFGFGDVNFDNQINSADSLAILKYCNGSMELSKEQLYWADVNRDSTVNSLDSYWIIKHCEGVISEFSDSLLLPDISPAFSIHTLYENDEKSSFAVKLDEGSFVNGTFTFTINEEKFANPVISRSEYFKNSAVEIADNGGYSLFNSNGLCVSIASTQMLNKCSDYIVLTVDKLTDYTANPEDIKLNVSDIIANVKNNITPNNCEHDFVTIITDATCSKEGSICEKCSKCGKVISTIVLPELIKNAVISENYIVNVQPGTDKNSFTKKYINSSTATVSFENLSNDNICTGTRIKIKNYNQESEEFSVIIYGDVSCDGQTDGMDSVILKCVNEGMLSTDLISDEVSKASDCNHDGSIDKSDAELLEKVGLSTEQIRQTISK